MLFIEGISPNEWRQLIQLTIEPKGIDWLSWMEATGSFVAGIAALVSVPAAFCAVWFAYKSVKVTERTTELQKELYNHQQNSEEYAKRVRAQRTALKRFIPCMEHFIELQFHRDTHDPTTGVPLLNAESSLYGYPKNYIKAQATVLARILSILEMRHDGVLRKLRDFIERLDEVTEDNACALLYYMRGFVDEYEDSHGEELVISRNASGAHPSMMD